MAKKKDERFVKVHEESGGILWEKAVFVDRQTGVNYLYIGAGNGGGLSVLLDASGKPVVTPIPDTYDD